MDLGRYSKFIGALVGNGVAIGIAWLVLHVPAITTCTPGPEGTTACTVIGFTQAEITATLMLAISSAAVYLFPHNSPPA